MNWKEFFNLKKEKVIPSSILYVIFIIIFFVPDTISENLKKLLYPIYKIILFFYAPINGVFRYVLHFWGFSSFNPPGRLFQAVYFPIFFLLYFLYSYLFVCLIVFIIKKLKKNAQNL